MAKMPGLLRPRQKIDEAELELDRMRLAARLADIFGGGDPTTPTDQSEADALSDEPGADQSPAADVPPAADGPPGPKRRGRSHPAIVIGPPSAGAGAGGAAREGAETHETSTEKPSEPRGGAMVGVMAGPGSVVAAAPGEAWWSAAVDYALDGGPGATAAADGGDASVVSDASDIGSASDMGIASDMRSAAEADEGALPDLLDLAKAGEVGDPGLALEAGPVDAPPAVPREADLDTPASRGIDTEPSTPARAKRRPPEPRSATKAQPAGKSPRSASARRAKPAKAAARVVAVAASCPYCAVLLEPPPTSSRGCPRCRHRIVVKRLDGRTVYLTEAAVLFFEAERRRIASSHRWTRERERWLKLGAEAGAPAERAARLAAAQLSEETVEAARALFMNTVERAFRSAKRDRRWEDASRIRREQAMALFRLARSPSTLPEAIITLHRDGVAAELRGIAEIAKEAELVGAACCDVCRADDGRICRIAKELLAPRLPHPGCPKGLCRCRWDLTARDRTILRRFQRRPARTNPRAVARGTEPTA